MPLKQINRLGQSVWVDYLSRDYLQTGEFEKHVSKGVTGATSNPSILEIALRNTEIYDKDIKKMVGEGKDSIDIYESLVYADVSVAASILHSVYALSHQYDGYVSLEVDPAFAHRTDATIYQGACLFAGLALPNIMIKVPATDEGIEAFKQLLFDGINVNMTLLFDVEQYEKVAWAYVEALEARKADGKSLKGIASVASFFVSRIDVAVNNLLIADASLKEERKEELWGKAAIACARLAYEKWYEVFHSTRFVALRSEGAQVQRLLWASTSNKYPPHYRNEDPLKYVTNLIAPETVNTLPLKTLDAIIECKDRVIDALPRYPSYNAEGVMEDLRGLRIDIKEVTSNLLVEGIQSFAESFDALMSRLYEKGREYASRNPQSRPGLV